MQITRFSPEMLVLVALVVMEDLVVLVEKVGLQETPMIRIPTLQPQHGATMKVVLVVMVVPVVTVAVLVVVLVAIASLYMRLA